ncbi:MAG TPA: HIRAN domain-containing protein [Longimicrobiaceae bacterium]|nr:HIRAN domain-containing protein [Longimicrobiaceae bacterium]
MGLFEWLHRSDPEPPTPSGMSRRDFFARVAGQGTRAEGEEQDAGSDGALCSFYVARFPYHDGPVLVPMLRPGMEFRLVPDPSHPTDPHAVGIRWGKDHLGYVTAEHSAEVRRRLEEGEALTCRSVSVDPAAELPRVLKVEVLPPADPVETEVADSQ